MHFPAGVWAAIFLIAHQRQKHAYSPVGPQQVNANGDSYHVIPKDGGLSVSILKEANQEASVLDHGLLRRLIIERDRLKPAASSTIPAGDPHTAVKQADKNAANKRLKEVLVEIETVNDRITNGASAERWSIDMTEFSAVGLWDVTDTFAPEPVEPETPSEPETEVVTPVEDVPVAPEPVEPETPSEPEPSTKKK